MKNKNNFQVVSPVNGEVYVERRIPSMKEVEIMLQKASKAQSSWALLPLQKRIDFCRKAVEYILNKNQEIGQEITWQMGRPIRFSPFEINKGFAERSTYMLDIAQKALASHSIQENAGVKRFMVREPHGIALVLAPWNYPYLTSVNAIIPALVAGNTVLLKHSFQTPLCAERYTEAFEHAGLPEGVFQCFHLDHGSLAKVVADNRISLLSFTGSVRGGRQMQQALQSRFIPTTLELGGKDPAYVRADADLDHTVAGIIDGVLFNSGQSCCGIERIYVDHIVYDDFISRVKTEVGKWKIGNPLDHETSLGPMAKASAAAEIVNLLDRSVRSGAIPLIPEGGKIVKDLGSAYLSPQILLETDHQMELMQEENFGPIAGIMKTRSDEEAIRLMNDSQYGLTASIWSKDIERVEQLGRQLETGTVFMNRCDYLDPALAWTGVKNTGVGCSLSEYGYHSVTRLKSFHLQAPI